MDEKKILGLLKKISDKLDKGDVKYNPKTDIENIIKYLKVVDSRLMRIESKIKKIK